LHARWSIAAARAGKHVLCEKPLACSEADGRAMFAAADEAGVQLLEAFPYSFQPQTLEVVRLVAGGAIGAVRVVQAAFGFPLVNLNDPRLDPLLGGGALLDVGCYPVSLARLLFGERPVRASAVARWTAGGVDESLAGTLEYTGGGVAQISCTFAASVHRRALVAGSAGVIETDYRNHTERLHEPSFRIKRGVDAERPFETVTVPRANGFRLEAEAFADRVADHGDRPDLRTASLDNLAAMTALIGSARTGRPVTITPSGPAAPAGPSSPA